ncbi:alpha/beta hydrolase fold domain-containing protein [Nonomuraea insulae]|uniref:Alpha/beta hydrolase fold domain-containing protein n=1 Tax=Nonomuraea insulae TaxID=1616787 RepID=A0ABW1D2Y2_9ACTN
MSAEQREKLDAILRQQAIPVEYGLAPERSHQAAVDDALAAYEALLRTGADSSDTVFAGESAGGGLAITTLVNIHDQLSGLPPLPVQAGTELDRAGRFLSAHLAG